MLLIDKMERKEPKIKDIIICDDIRKENSGKFIFIGVYPAGNIIVRGKMPYVFPKLCFILKFIGGKGEYDIETILKNPDQKQIVSLPAGSLNFEDENREFMLFLSIATLKIDKVGEYTFEIYEQKEKKLIYKYKFSISHQEI